MKIAQFMENLDVFGKKICLTIDGKNSMKTKLGSATTLIFIILLGLIIYLNTVELFNKENPISYEQTTVSSEHPGIVLNKSSFLFKFNYSDVNGAFINISDYFEYDLVYYEYYYNESHNFLFLKNTTIIPLIKCNELIDNGSEDNNLCFRDDQSLYLEGYWDQKALKYFRLNFYTCNPKTNKNCHSLDEIFKYSGDNLLNVNFYFNRNSIQISNFTNPISKNSFVTYKFLTNQQKITNFLIETDSLHTDKGFLTEDVQSNSFFNVQELQTDTAPYGDDSRIVYIASFYASNVFRNTQRSYIKVQDIFAKVGGIANVIFFIFKYFINIFSKIQMNTKIMNSIYCEEETRLDLQSSCSPSLNQRSRIQNIVENNVEDNSGSRNLKIESFTRKSTKNLDIKFGFIEFIKLFFVSCKRPNNKKFFEYFKYEERLNDYYDIIHFFKKFEEFELLKFITLTQNQLKQFNLIKPRLNMKFENSEKSRETHINDLQINKKSEDHNIRTNNYMN